MLTSLADSKRFLDRHNRRNASSGPLSLKNSRLVMWLRCLMYWSEVRPGFRSSVGMVKTSWLVKNIFRNLRSEENWKVTIKTKSMIWVRGWKWQNGMWVIQILNKFTVLGLKFRERLVVRVMKVGKCSTPSNWRTLISSLIVIGTLNLLSSDFK